MSPSTSPFPPIADYAFLSNCHTGALVAPDGSVDWLCVPAFDSASTFGNLLDRGAGSFRFGPYGINVPTQRYVRPRDPRPHHDLAHARRLAAGARRAHDGDASGSGPRHAAHPAPGRRRRRARPGASGRVPRGLGRGRDGLRAGLRLRPGARRRGRWWTRTATLPTRPGPGRRSGSAPTSRSASRAARRAPGTRWRRANAPSARCRGPRAWPRPSRRRRRRPAHRGDGPVLAELAGPRPDPRPRAPAPPGAVGAHDQGPDLHADRCHGGGPDHLAAGDPGGRAQLGLPLHVDARHHLHPAGAALPQPRLGGRRVHAVRGRSRAEPGRRPADHVRHRRTTRPDRVDPGRAVRLRRRPSGPDRQRSLRPAPERRVRRGAGLAPAAHPPQQAPAPPAVAAGAVAGGRCAGVVARAGPGDLGGPRGSAALRVVEADGLGRAGPRRQAGGDPRRRGAREEVGRRPRRRSAPTSSPTG